MPGYQTADRRPQSPPRRQRACLPCTKAKARCHYEDNEVGDGCNRCLRLKISCTPQTTKSLRRPRQVKLQNAFEHVKVVPAPKQVPHDLPITDSRGIVVDDVGVPGEPRKHYSIPSHTKTSIPHYLPPNPGFGITWDQAQKAVEDFALIFTAHFPFMILDHDITARRLFVEKPLLFRAILMIGIDFTVSKSREIRRSIDAWIGQHLLVMEEQSLGALQGLLVYIIWATPDFYSDHRITQLIYFAVGLAHSLGITKQAPTEDTQVREEAEINEEHRTFLACFYVISFNSFQFGRPNPLSSTHVQYCTDSLERSSEFPTDFLLIKLVKFRLFIGRVPNVYQGICDMKWCREISDDASEQLHEIRKDLDDFISDVAHKHPKLLLLWTLHNSALIQLHLPMTYATADSEESKNLQLECLQYCLKASRTFASMAKSFSPDGLLYAPFTTLTDLISMFIATSRLLLVEIDGWDLKEARQSINLKAAMDEMIEKFTIGAKVKTARVAAAAVENPSSYMPDGPDEEKQDRIQVLLKLIECIRDWLNDQGAFLSSNEEPKHDDMNNVQASNRVHVSPQSPQWNFTYFFESLLQME
ncbi:hypothetical protein F4859DRAFT_483242 [Xylaria cf. heliscus]|nr:hypothetical protein F4859DRAFT_483242 [Xylaria cf. heliscus]